MQSAETISITLPDELMRLIREEVAAGRYASAGDVVHEAMRLWRDREREHDELVGDLRAQIDRSLADPRPSRPLNDVFDRLEQRHADRVKGPDDL